MEGKFPELQKISVPLAALMWFTIAFILILLLCTGILVPWAFGMYTKITPHHTTPKRSHKWEGPKTDARINRMLCECIEFLKELGVPVSNSICPQVRLIGSHRTYGRCCARGSLKRYTKYDFYIELSGHILNKSDKFLRNTIIHELLHTVPDGLCHTGEWKKWAKYVNARTGYNIQRLAGDEG